MKTKFQSKSKQEKNNNNNNTNCAASQMSNRVTFIFVSLFISTNYELEPNVSMLMFDCRQTDNTFALKLTFRFSFVFFFFITFSVVFVDSFEMVSVNKSHCWSQAEAGIENKMSTRVNRRLLNHLMSD